LIADKISWHDCNPSVAALRLYSHRRNGYSHRAGKYQSHHRNTQRDMGLELSKTTLAGWVLKVGELLMPMVAAMRQELIGGPCIQADETPVYVQT
ncbi:MAG TPA: transposase, partial [Terriglobales bacterium]